MEVLGMPLSLKIMKGPGADNRELIYIIYEGIKKTVAGLIIKRINWLHGLPSRRLRNLALIKKRGILIISFLT